MLRLLKDNQPVVLLMILVLGLLAWLQTLIMAGDTFSGFDHNPAPLYELLLRWFGNAEILKKIAGFLFLVLISYQVLRLNARFLLIKQRSYIPAFFFVMIASSIPELQGLNPATISLVFLLIALERCFESYRDTHVSFKYFEAAIFISFGSMFYYNMLWFLLILFICMSVLRPFYWREWYTALAGILVPWMFLFSMHYIIYGSVTRVLDGLVQFFQAAPNYNNYGIAHLVWIGFLALLLVTSSWSMVMKFSMLKVNTRKYLKVLLWIFIIGTMLTILIPSAGIELFVVVAVPLSYLFTEFVYTIRSDFLARWLIWVFLLCILFIQVSPW
jgi:hypothetical protein